MKVPGAAFDAIVVGGGVAGLVAATTLASHGRRVKLLEARGRLGGRAASFRERVSGEIVDNGQHILMGCYRETLRWLDLVGSADGLWSFPRLRVPFIDASGVPTVLSCPPLPPPWHLVAGVLCWRALRWSERLTILRLARVVRALSRTSSYADAWALAPRGETVAEWLDRHGQSIALQDLLWGPLTVAALNQSPAHASAGALLAVLKGVAAGTAADARILLPTRPLGDLFGNATARFLEERGSVVRLNSPAKVTCHDRGATVTTRGERLEAPIVIVAVPWFHVSTTVQGPADVMAPLKQAVDSLSWAPIVSVNLWFDHTVLGEPFVGLPGRTMQWAFGHVSPRRGQRVSLVVSDALEAMRMSDDALVDLAVGELRAALRMETSIRARHAVVVREPRATFWVGPGEARRPAASLLAPHAYLAGDWVDTGLPSTIESAAIGGRAAAEAALAAFR